MSRHEGGLAAAATNKRLYDSISDHPNGFYGRIGTKGGKISRGGGFAANHDLAVAAGRRGGRSPRRIKTHCKWGHEFTAENTDIYLGHRYCRACREIRRIKKKAANQ